MKTTNRPILLNTPITGAYNSPQARDLSLRVSRFQGTYTQSRSALYLFSKACECRYPHTIYYNGIITKKEEYINIKFFSMQNLQHRKADSKFQAKPEYGMPKVDFIAKHIAGRFSLATINNMIPNYLKEVPTFMLLGYSVKLNELGTFSILFSSKGILRATDFRTNMINGLEVIYAPAQTSKHALKTVPLMNTIT